MKTSNVMFYLIATSCLAACATPSTYQWSSYDTGLYQMYKDPDKAEELRVTLETLIQDQEKNGKKVAPGLYAELGTLYLQKGAPDMAIDMYTKERDAWPESKGLMDALIKNLQRRKQASIEVKQ